MVRGMSLQQERRMGMFKANVMDGKTYYILAENIAKAAEIAEESTGRDGPAILSVEMVTSRFFVSSNISLSVGISA
jgi:hypothetical protein